MERRWPKLQRTETTLIRQGKPGRWWTVIIGGGVALSPVHNQWLTSLATNSDGNTLFFLPAFGYLLLIMGSGLFPLNNWQRVKEVGWGDRRIVGSLLFIVLAIAASGAAYTGLQDRFAPLGMGLVLFSLYLTGRVLGKDVFLPLAIGAIIASLGIIVAQMWQPDGASGGLIFERNYDIATGYILLGVVLLINRKWQWKVVALALPALSLSGSAEALFAIGVLGLAVLLRKDWGPKLLAVVTPVVILLTIVIVTGYGQPIYRLAAWGVTGNQSYMPADRNPEGGNLLERRWSAVEESLTDIQPLGEGYNLTEFQKTDMVHNVPLVIVQQLGWPGILAGIAWLWISLWCLAKTRWKYAWVLILSLAVFDHYIWTQLAPLWPLVVGASMTSTVKSDLIFRKVV